MRLKGGMSLRNFMWHGPRNDIIIQNVIYTKWPKEINYQESMRASLPRHFFGGNLRGQPFCLSIYYCWLKPTRQSRKKRYGFTAFVSM